MASAVSRDRQVLVLSVRSRTMANVLSMGLVLRTYCQCSVGMSLKAKAFFYCVEWIL